MFSSCDKTWHSEGLVSAWHQRAGSRYSHNLKLVDSCCHCPERTRLSFSLRQYLCPLLTHNTCNRFVVQGFRKKIGSLEIYIPVTCFGNVAIVADLCLRILDQIDIFCTNLPIPLWMMMLIIRFIKIARSENKVTS